MVDGIGLDWDHATGQPAVDRVGEVDLVERGAAHAVGEVLGPHLGLGSMADGMLRRRQPRSNATSVRISVVGGFGAGGGAGTGSRPVKKSTTLPPTRSYQALSCCWAW